VAANKKIFIGPGEGAYLPVLDITHKVTAENFGGAFTIIEVGLAPGEMIPPHTHAREDECAYVLEGELTFDVGGEVMVASAGGAGGGFMGAADEFGLGSGRVPSRIGVGAGIRYGGCVRWCSRWTVVD
jgi:Cupin domain